VFVDGCFWHGCPEHGAKEFRGPNAEMWRQKLEANRARDRRNDAAAEQAGWRVLHVWECEVREDSGAAAQRVRRVAEALP
jgi:DNA mismatch endonuclease (patch repair protein)